MWVENAEIKISSRNNILSYENDNAGCYKTLIKDERYNAFFNNYPNLKLVGEWLVPHTIKYIPDAYKKFYVFDAIHLGTEEENGKCTYFDFAYLVELLSKYNIEYVPYVCYRYADKTEIVDMVKNAINNHSTLCNYLTENGQQGEGLVLKNYDYKNQFGRSIWVKLINEEYFKKRNKPVKKIKIVDSTKEHQFIEANITNHLLSKCYYKLAVDGVLDNKDIGNFIKLCQTEFFEDFTNDYLKENNIVDYNHKAANNIIAKYAKYYLKTAID
jgi:hypothetical protein